MTSEHPVPPDVTASGERIRGRSAESEFARFPASETIRRARPGGGPEGPVAAGPLNRPLVVMTVGAIIAFSVFFISTWLVLVLGLLVVLVGAGMSIVTHHRPGRRSGLGPSMVKDAPPSGRD